MSLLLNNRSLVQCIQHTSKLKTTKRTQTKSLTQRERLDLIATKLNITKPEEWYHISQNQIISVGGKPLLYLHESSTYELLRSVYTEYPWNPNRRSKSIVNDVEQQKKVLDVISKSLNITKPEDWYQVAQKAFIAHGGAKLLACYNFSLYKILNSVYPEIAWDPIRFTTPPRGTMKDINNQRKVMEQVATKLGVKEPADWYNVTAHKVIKVGGYTVLNLYGRSLSKALQAIYSDFKWEMCKFPDVTIMSNMDKQRAMLDAVGKKLNITSPEEWYQVQQKDLREAGASSLLNLYSGSPYNVLRSVYSEYQWDPTKFRMQRNHWTNEDNQKRFLEALMSKNDIKNPADMATFMTAQEVEQQGGRGLLSKYNGSLTRCLQQLYKVDLTKQQKRPWNLISGQLSRGQDRLLKLVKEMFSDREVLCNYRPSTLNLEFDIFIPSLSLAFEYQGKQHYHATIFGDLDTQQKRDQLKTQFCKVNGIVLVEIPHWLSQTPEVVIKAIVSPPSRVDIAPLTSSYLSKEYFFLH